jgi:hypothetical protein
MSLAAVGVVYTRAHFVADPHMHGLVRGGAVSSWHVGMHVTIYLCIYTYTLRCTRVYICMYIELQVYIYICMYMYIYTHRCSRHMVELYGARLTGRGFRAAQVLLAERQPPPTCRLLQEGTLRMTSHCSGIGCDSFAMAMLSAAHPSFKAQPVSACEMEPFNIDFLQKAMRPTPHRSDDVLQVHDAVVHVYTYIYIYMHVCICIYIYAFRCGRTHVHSYIHIFRHTYISWCISLCVCMRGVSPVCR